MPLELFTPKLPTVTAGCRDSTQVFKLPPYQNRKIAVPLAAQWSEQRAGTMAVITLTWAENKPTTSSHSTGEGTRKSCPHEGTAEIALPSFLAACSPTTLIQSFPLLTLETSTDLPEPLGRLVEGVHQAHQGPSAARSGGTAWYLPGARREQQAERGAATQRGLFTGWERNNERFAA